MLQLDSIQQSLVVRISQAARPQQIRQVLFDLCGSVGITGNLAGPLLPPQFIGPLEYGLKLRSEHLRPACLAFHHFLDVPYQMREAFVLLHPGQLLGFVTGEAVCHQNPGVVAGDEFPHFLIAMSPPNLIYGLLVGIEGHQVGSVTADPPTGIVGVSHRRMRTCLRNS